MFLTTHITVSVCHAEINDYLLTYFYNFDVVQHNTTETFGCSQATVGNRGQPWTYYKTWPPPSPRQAYWERGFKRWRCLFVCLSVCLSPIAHMWGYCAITGCSIMTSAQIQKCGQLQWLYTNNLSRSPAQLCQTMSRTADVWNQSIRPIDSLQAAVVRGTVWLHMV